MWDEIILVWNMKLLLKQWKKLVIACSNKEWLINFHKQFLLNNLEWWRNDLEWWKLVNSEQWIVNNKNVCYSWLDQESHQNKQINQKKDPGLSPGWQQFNNFEINSRLQNDYEESLEDYLKSYLVVNEDGFYDKKTGEQIITYLPELPKWFRSLFRFLKNIKNIKKYFSTDSILIWWWEIFTEETPGSYWYWLFSVWFLLFWRKLYLSGWIQFPKKLWNKIPFWVLTKKAEKLLVRDYDLLNSKNKLLYKTFFFPDTSIFVYDNIDLKNYKWNIEKKERKSYIVVNVNKKAEQFLPQIEEKIKQFYNKNYDVYFAEICKSPKDMDLKYYKILKEKFPNIKLLDWENWDEFIDILLQAEKVFTTRLHLFLISFYLNLDVNPFVYQKKVEKMKKVLFKLDK